MLKQRLLFGILMIIVFTGLLVFGGWLDSSITFSQEDDAAVQGTIFFLLVAFLMVPAHKELAFLGMSKSLLVFVPVTSFFSIFLAGTWYFSQFLSISTDFYVIFLCAFSVFGVFLWQHIRHGNSGTMGNCGVSIFSIFYLGLLSGLAVAIRVDYGFWGLILFIFAVKSTDIGAYFVGSAFGKHKFAPTVSPNKSWEGMAGGAGLSIIVSVIISLICGIISPVSAVLFGLGCAFVGQLGDCAESMIKRDAAAKDAAKKIPAFGGVLDIIDSPLVAAVFAYLFFSVFIG